MRKKLLSLILSLVMCLVLTIPAMAYTISGGNAIWETSNATTGTEQVTFQVNAPTPVEAPFPGFEDAVTPSFGGITSEQKQLTVQTFPVGTIITIQTAAYGDDAVDILKYNLQGELVDDTVMLLKNFSLTLSDSNCYYGLYSVEERNSDAIVTSVENTIWYIKATSVGEMPTTPTVTATATGFTDVAADAYYAAPVAWAVEKGITKGTDEAAKKFSPGQNCTNAQILTFLWRAYGQPEPTIGNPYTNSIPDAYVKAAVWAYEKGMVSGTAFDVDRPCTRAMAVTYMWQAAGSPMPSVTASFTDVPAGSSYALAVAWAVEKEITRGTNPEGTMFSPDEICNRGQIVTFLHRNLA